MFIWPNLAGNLQEFLFSILFGFDINQIDLACCYRKTITDGVVWWEVDYLPVTACAEMFYSCYTIAIWQWLHLLLIKEGHVIIFICLKLHVMLDKMPVNQVSSYYRPQIYLEKHGAFPSTTYNNTGCIHVFRCSMFSSFDSQLFFVFCNMDYSLLMLATYALHHAWNYSGDYWFAL